MQKVEALAINTQISYPRGTELQQLNFQGGQLDILIVGCQDESGCRVLFEEVIGFKVLDEREMLEYWPVCSTPNGWIFEVSANGWLQQDQARFALLNAGGLKSKLKEYVITGINECVCVISRKSPLICLSE